MPCGNWEASDGVGAVLVTGMNAFAQCASLLDSEPVGYDDIFALLGAVACGSDASKSRYDLAELRVRCVGMAQKFDRCD